MRQQVQQHYLKKKLEEIANKCEGEEQYRNQRYNFKDLCYCKTVREKLSKKILPVVFCYSALKLFNGEKFDEVQKKLKVVVETRWRLFQQAHVSE